jgi:hypothetical protein
MIGPRHLRCLLLLVVMATGLRAEARAAGEPGKTGNWLVDAMDEKSTAARGAAQQGAQPREGLAAAPAGSRPEDGAANPLASYLATWMTPHDREVLGLNDSAQNPTGVAGATGRESKPRGRLTAGAPANPYLPGPAPVALVDGKAPPSTPAANLPAPAALTDKIDAAPAQPPGPPAAVLKSQDAAKYFPQLKRF